ncbi:MAG TPA: FixH family protein [Vicinamibacterales bacterium]
MRLNWGTGIALVYGVFAASTVGFVAFAMHQPVDLVSEDYYGQSLRYDERRMALENAAALGPNLVTAAADGRIVTIAFPQDQARGTTGTARLYRPSDSSADRTVPLALDAGGRQQLSLEDLPPGRWIVQVTWSREGRTFYRELEVMAR